MGSGVLARGIYVLPALCRGRGPEDTWGGGLCSVFLHFEVPSQEIHPWASLYSRASQAQFSQKSESQFGLEKQTCGFSRREVNCPTPVKAGWGTCAHAE